MAELDVYRIPGTPGYVLEVQTDLLASLATAVVVPLFPIDTSPKPIRRLNPIFEIEGVAHVLVTQFIAAVPRKDLGTPVGSLGERNYYEVANALDMLLAGS